MIDWIVNLCGGKVVQEGPRTGICLNPALNRECTSVFTAKASSGITQ